MVSALTETGMMQAWDDMQALATWRKDNGHWAARRADQARTWFETEVREGLLARLTADPALAAQLDQLGQDVASGRAAPGAAAQAVLKALDS